MYHKKSLTTAKVVIKPIIFDKYQVNATTPQLTYISFSCHYQSSYIFHVTNFLM